MDTNAIGYISCRNGLCGTDCIGAVTRMGVRFGRLTVTEARPDIAELHVFLGQHILLTLEQHFNPKI